MRRGIIKEFILSWKGLLGFGFVIVIVSGIQWGAYAMIRNNTVTVRNETCILRAFDHSNVQVVMKLDCRGSEDETKNPQFISAYLQKPGPFTCTRYVWAYADCKLQEVKKSEK